MIYRLIVAIGLLAIVAACAPAQLEPEPQPGGSIECPDQRPGNGDETDGGVGGTGKQDGTTGKPRC